MRKLCIRNFILSTFVLKKGAKKGLTIHDISKILYRDNDDQITEIQKLIDKTYEYIDAVYGEKHHNFKKRICKIFKKS